MSSKAEDDHDLSPIERLFRTFKCLISEESSRYGAAYEPRPTDIIICTGLKCGTTITQQICHGLRSYGDMSFEEISDVVPCIEQAIDEGYGDLYAAQTYQPHMFKSHFPYRDVPKGAGKYIILVRNPYDAALSCYNFIDGWLFAKDEISLGEFIEAVWISKEFPKSCCERPLPIHHMASWYPHRLDPNVLWLHYEDLRQDSRGCVKLIAEFLDIGANDNRLQELVTKQSSLDFMKMHIEKFGDNPLKIRRNKAVGLPENAGLTEKNAKVRTGLVNAGKDIIPKTTLAKIDDAWNVLITSIFGYKSYEELRDGINKELNRSFT